MKSEIFLEIWYGLLSKTGNSGTAKLYLRTYSSKKTHLAALIVMQR